MCPKDADGIDPDQTAPLGSTLFTETCLSENLGTRTINQTQSGKAGLIKVECENKIQLQNKILKYLDTKKC